MTDVHNLIDIENKRVQQMNTYFNFDILLIITSMYIWTLYYNIFYIHMWIAVNWCCYL